MDKPPGTLAQFAGKIWSDPHVLLTVPARRVTAKIVQTAGLLPGVGFTERKVIIFLVPRREAITGGVLSIFNLYNFSRELAALRHAKIFMCFYPGEGGGTSRYVKFDNDVTIYPFEWVLAMCRRVETIQFHVAEYAVQSVVERIGEKRFAQLCARNGLRLNILNQNILLMPDDAFLENLRRIAPERLTCTTAHPSYSTVEFRRKWQMPVHHLPAWTHPDDASATPYETKRDLLIVSPDPSPFREVVLRRIAADLPHLEIRVISGMRFQDYLQLTRQAKWSLTFGEGMDDYFLAVFYRGGAGFAVYNEDFFTPEFKNLRTIFPDWETLAAKITSQIKALDNKQAMESYNAEVRPLLTKTWSRQKTIASLEAFYRGDFTLP